MYRCEEHDSEVESDDDGSEKGKNKRLVLLCVVIIFFSSHIFWVVVLMWIYAKDHVTNERGFTITAM